MWQVKQFKTRDVMERFIAGRKIEWQEVFINWDGKPTSYRYAIQYRYLRVI